jgi:hypothetical protein
MSHWVHHLVEMTLAMAAGMVAGGAIFAAATGAAPGSAVTDYPISFVVVMAASMTLPMLGWMRYRGDAWRACAEMGAAMAAPALVLIVLRATHVIGGAICGGYCALSFVAMLAVAFYRRTQTPGMPITLPG